MSWAGPFQTPIGKSGNTHSTTRAGSEATVYDPARPTLLCLSHLRWNFVWQRPQQLMSRIATDYNVFFFEEPLSAERGAPWLEVRHEPEGVTVLVPRLPDGLDSEAVREAQRDLLDEYLAEMAPAQLLLWYYTPMSLAFSDHLVAAVTLYDCMDELSAFRGAPPDLVAWERQLLARADLVFTGGYSLYESKRDRHANVHPFPSSVEVAHFVQARSSQADPADQAGIPHPRLGFYGVIDERIDLELLDQIAAQRPDWQLVLVGPVVKIDPAALPQRSNIHYFGGKPYDELPHYLGGWDVAIMPFAINESTRFISPTKTPEYLAGGCPVVSTPITDVVRTYGDTGIVRIAGDATAWLNAVDAALADAQDTEQLLDTADRILGDMSWDDTWSLMKEKISCAKQTAHPRPRDWSTQPGSFQQERVAPPERGQGLRERAVLTTSSWVQDLPAAFSPNASPQS